jgi:hypothetical protein
MTDYSQQSKRQLLREQPSQRARNRRMSGADRRKLQLESQQVASEISRLERFIRAPKSQGRKRFSRLDASMPVAAPQNSLFGSPLSGPIRLEMHRQRRARLMHLVKFVFWLVVLLAFCGWLAYWSAMV